MTTESKPPIDLLREGQAIPRGDGMPRSREDKQRLDRQDRIAAARELARHGGVSKAEIASRTGVPLDQVEAMCEAADLEWQKKYPTFGRAARPGDAPKATPTGPGDLEVGADVQVS